MRTWRTPGTSLATILLFGIADVNLKSLLVITALSTSVSNTDMCYPKNLYQEVIRSDGVRIITERLKVQSVLKVLNVHFIVRKFSSLEVLTGS